MASESYSRGAGRRSPKRAAAIMALFLAIVPMIAAGCGTDTTTAPTATPAPAPTPTAVALPAYWPTTGWRASTPEQQGVESQGLLNALQHVQDAGINLRSIMVIRNGYVVLEAYNQPYTATHKFNVYSVTKSVTGALTGIALHEGYIKDVGAHMLDYFPGLQVSNLDEQKKAITVDDLLTMRSGLDGADDKLGYNTVEQSPNWVNYMLNLPMASQPGEKMAYCTGCVDVLSAILTKATGMNAAQYAQPRLFDPLGITKGDVAWFSDPQGNSIGGYGIQLKPSDMAKLGLLYLNDGKWDGKQIVSKEWVQTSTQKHTVFFDGTDYGYLIWIYPSHYEAQGRGGQTIMVVKDRNMVVVTTAAINDDRGPEIEGLLDNYIIPAAKANGPLPENRAAYDALQAKVAYMANPVQPVAALNDTAKRVSGKTYAMDKNDLGYDTLKMDFVEGSPVVTVTLGTANGPTVGVVGLDNVYRVTGSMDSDWSALRGRWTGANTFEAREMQSSPDIQEEAFRLEFTGDTLKMHVEEPIYKTGNMDIHGVMKK